MEENEKRAKARKVFWQERGGNVVGWQIGEANPGVSWVMLSYAWSTVLSKHLLNNSRHYWQGGGGILPELGSLKRPVAPSVILRIFKERTFWNERPVILIIAVTSLSFSYRKMSVSLTGCLIVHHKSWILPYSYRCNARLDLLPAPQLPVHDISEQFT